MGNTTNELRDKLDELGVRWWPDVYYRDTNTCWRVGDFEWRASEKKDGKLLIGCTCVKYLTPEQAIAATVGRGNLTAEQVREAIMSADRWEKPMGDTGMTNTHLIIRDDGWQAITDELNATVGVGTCRNKGFVDDGGWYFVCSKCGCEFEYGDFACEFAEGHGLGSPKFCPNCGKRIVEEEAE